MGYLYLLPFSYSLTDNGPGDAAEKLLLPQGDHAPTKYMVLWAISQMAS